MDSIKFLYITCKDLTEARKIGQDLIHEHLAACVNIIPGMESLYRWQGKIESAQEVILIVKTRSTLVNRCIDFVKGIHTYEIPCILVINIELGHQPYIDWLLRNTSKE